MKNSRVLLIVFLISSLTVTSTAQKSKGEPLKHEREVRDMVAFLQFMLNTLGDPSTPARDKDVVITESYSKIFRDAKVQIEDDLDEERFVITNKDVQAYLKDVDFFFKDVRFEFTIDKIEAKGTPEDKLFYIVTTTRNLKGTTADGKPVNNTKKRFIEINFNAAEEDLKVVSVYTNEFNEKTALLSWWNELPYEWQTIFRREINLQDSMTLDAVKAITSIDSLDLSSNLDIQNINPLIQLLDLKMLNLSGTNIRDLTPIRNLTNIAHLDISHTYVRDLSPLRYAEDLRYLSITHTPVDSLTVFEKLVNLNALRMAEVPVKDFSPLKFLTKLKVLSLRNTSFSDIGLISSSTTLVELNLALTSVTDIAKLADFNNLQIIKLDSVGITDLGAMSGLKKLKSVSINYTKVANLDPLRELPALERIYCDDTGIRQSDAKSFMDTNPNILVIHDSEDLRGWWQELPSVWKDVLSRTGKVGYNPTKEGLASLTKLDSINLSNYVSIRSLEPLRQMPGLKILLAPATGITDVSALKDHLNLQRIDISNTNVTDVSVLTRLKSLRILKAGRTRIRNIDTLAVLKNLRMLYVDETDIDDEQVRSFRSRNGNPVVIYQSAILEEWWKNLPEEWRQIFGLQLKMGPKVSREKLHELTQLHSIQFGDVRVDDLSVLRPFIFLRHLSFSSTAIRDLSPLAELDSLVTLHISDNPTRDLEPLAVLRNLEDLNISNTAVDDLEPVGRLRNLRILNCSGTQIRNLNDLKTLDRLESLDCSNTDIRSLNPVKDAPLTTLKCYNTKISRGKIKSFKRRNPDCNIVYY